MSNKSKRALQKLRQFHQDQDFSPQAPDKCGRLWVSWSEAACAEYASAVLVWAQSQGLHPVIRAGLGERWDSEEEETVNVNIHCTVLWPDGSEMDYGHWKDSPFLADAVVEWETLHWEADATSDIAEFASKEELCKELSSLDLPFNEAWFKEALAHLEKSLTSSLT
jgi:hypothetical protein